MLTYFDFPLLLLIWWIPKGFAVPRALASVQYRTDPIWSRAISPLLKTSVLGTNGVDVTSSFQTLTYWAPQPAEVVDFPDLSTDEETDMRYLRTCSSNTADFAGSHCLYKPGINGSMQKYVVHCREERLNPTSTHPASNEGLSRFHFRKAELGTCFADEVCMPGIREVWEGSLTYTARCVKKDSFRPLDSIRAAQNQEPLGNRTATVVLSQSDGQTPLEAGSMRVDALDTRRTLQKKNCTNCVKLRTAQLPSDSYMLTLDAWLDKEKFSTLPMAGIIWIVIQLANW